MVYFFMLLAPLGIVLQLIKVIIIIDPYTAYYIGYDKSLCIQNFHIYYFYIKYYFYRKVK